MAHKTAWNEGHLAEQAKNQIQSFLDRSHFAGSDRSTERLLPFSGYNAVQHSFKL